MDETQGPGPSSLLLTPREREILQLLGDGHSNREIAEQLHVSEKDVEYHVGNLLRKLGSRNRTGAVSRGYELGYLSVGPSPPKSANSPDDH